MNEWKLAASLTGTLVLIPPRGFNPKDHCIQTEFYDITADLSTARIAPKRDPLESEGRIIIFRPSISRFSEIDIVNSIDLISLKSEALIEAVTKVILPQGVKIGNSYSVESLIVNTEKIGSEKYPFVLIDNSLDSIKQKIPHLPRGSLFLLVETFALGETHGIVQIPASVSLNGNEVGKAMILKDCLDLFEKIALNTPLNDILNQYPQVGYLQHNLNDLVETRGEPYYFQAT
jgi:hypothetical protein